MDHFSSSLTFVRLNCCNTNTKPREGKYFVLILSFKVTRSTYVRYQLPSQIMMYGVYIHVWCVYIYVCVCAVPFMIMRRLTLQSKSKFGHLSRLETFWHIYDFFVVLNISYSINHSMTIPLYRPFLRKDVGRRCWSRFVPIGKLPVSSNTPLWCCHSHRSSMIIHCPRLSF